MQSERQALLWICEARHGDYCHLQLGPLLKKHDFDVAALFALAVSNGLVPLCYRNSERLVPGLLPENIRQKFRQRYQKIARRNLQVTAECQRINKACEDLDITITHFKGATLAMQLYGDPTMRTYCDIDALVSKEDQKKLHSSLNKMGYIYKHNFTPRQYKHQLKYGKDMPYKHINKSVSLELHWHYSYFSPHLANLSQNPLRYSDSMIWHNYSFNTLQKPAYANYLAFHGSLEGWKQLKWLIDFYHMMQQCDAAEVLQLSRALGVERIAGHAIQLCRHYFIKRPGRIDRLDSISRYCAKLARPLIEQEMQSHLRQRIQKHRLLFFIWPSSQARLHSLRRTLNTNSADWAAYKIPDYLFYLYLFIRPIHWIKRFVLNG